VRQSRALNVVCGHLRAGLLGGPPPGEHPWLAWESLIEVSSRHCVTPALAWCLRDKAFLPADARRYFDAVLTLNGKRNEKLLKALARVAAALNAIDIEPVLLKGAAHLVECVYPAPGLRMLGDLDVLVAEDRVKNAAGALQKIGFTAGGPTLPENHHHWPMLLDPETGAAVELHIGALHRRSEHIMPTAEFHKNAHVVAFRGTRVRLPDATRSVAHSIVHDALDHQGYLRQTLELRQLLDLVMIRTKHESTVGWAELDRRFSAAGVGYVLAASLEFAKGLFGLPLPSIHLSERQRRARRRTEPWIRMARTATDYVAARRRDPWGVFNLFKPNMWPRTFHTIRAALGKPGCRLR
jgi:Uncharacterised nucleotidyltransferase